MNENHRHHSTRSSISQRRSVFDFDTQTDSNSGDSKFVDHYSLQALSDTVKFRDTTIHVYEQNDRQLLLEERIPGEDESEGNREFMMKLVDDDNVGMILLRLSYTLVAFVMSGTLLVFFFNIICVTFLSISIHIDSTSIEDYKPSLVAGTVLSIPIFVNGMSAAMAKAGTFTLDSWHGHTFLRMVASWSGVATEWITFFAMLGIPLLTMLVTLCARYDDWWVTTGLLWFMSVFIFYLVFTAIVTYYEVIACFDLLWFDPDNREKRTFSLMKKTILLHFIQRFSGEKQISYFKHGTTDPTMNSTSVDTPSSQTWLQEKIDLYSRFTMISCCKCIFDHLGTPMPIYDIDKMKGTKYFLTKNGWSLTKGFFKYKSSNSIVVVRGPAAITRCQLHSSFACSILGLFLMLTLSISMMVWYDLSAYIEVPIAIVIALMMIPAIRASINHLRLYNELQERELRQSEDGLSRVINRVTERFRVTKAKDTFCWIIFLLQVFFLFLCPTVTFFVTKNYELGCLFMTIAVVSSANYFFNAKVIISELGSLDNIVSEAVTRGRSQYSVTARFPQEKRSRIALITEKITSSRSHSWWHFVFVGFAMIIFVLYIMAITWDTTDDTVNNLPTLTFLPNFYYQAQSAMPYPTCQVKNGVMLPENLITLMLADFALLSAIAYRSSVQTQLILDSWFGKNIATDQSDIVNKFEMNYTKSDVVYKFINVTIGDFKTGVVSVRGTQNAWELLEDIQLWCAAALSQGLRIIIPLGELWTPILPSLIEGASVFGKNIMKNNAFYKRTTTFVNYLLDSNEYDAILITGHSLGGGIAMITGAQTGIPSIGISGVNSMLSRKTFDPPITKEQLDLYTFNVIPDRDVVPAIDDPAQNYQKIRCLASPKDHIDCHSLERALCELLYQCGTGGAPAICECTLEFGYPKPLAKHGTNQTFEEACANRKPW